MATQAVAAFPSVSIENVGLAGGAGRYRTVLLCDVIEHIESDREAMALAATHICPGGFALLSVPSNPREWRWDDQMVGHYRRYSVASMSALLRETGLEPVEFWDFTFPIFWLMRRGYTWLKRGRRFSQDLEQRTKSSSMVQAWYIPIVGDLLNRPSWIWRLLYRAQFALFRSATSYGHEFLVLARKRG